MAAFASGGTFVSAVLETSGYLTQAEILLSFKSFFTSAGALIYVIACIGAVVSVALFGSYEKARYLLVGPTLFIFLVGNTASTKACIWKLGDGDPRNIFTEADEGASRAATTVDNSRGSVAAVLGRLGVDEEKARRQAEEDVNKLDDIKVAWFFDWYTKLISGSVNAIVSVILAHENNENLLFIARTQALEMLTNARVNDPETLGMLTGVMMSQCAPWMDAQSAMSSPVFSETHAAALLQEGKTTQWQELQKELETLKRDSNQAAAISVKPNEAMLNFMERHSTAPAGTTDGTYDLVQAVMQSYAKVNPEAAGKSFKELRPQLRMQCIDAYKITRQRVLEVANVIWKKVREKHEPDQLQTAEGNADLLCQMLGRKITDRQYLTRDPGTGQVLGGADHCDLVEVAAIYMIRDAVSSSTRSQIAQQEADRFQMMKPVRKNTLFAQISHGENWEATVDASGEHNVRIIERTRNLPKHQRQYVAEFQNRFNPAEKQWLPFSRISEIKGNRSAAFNMQQAYETRGLRQKIFTFATNLPYWQGTILYLLALSYPFLCLMVLMPGRAVTFLHVPLAWLWIKSWDIGFAVVMVMDEMLWQMLPHFDIRPEVAANDLSSTLSEALKVDPTFHIHQYYFFISLALLSVPAVTGYVCMKAKKAVLSSFTDGPKNAATDAGGSAAQSFGIRPIADVRAGQIQLGGGAFAMNGTQGSLSGVPGNRAAQETATLFAQLSGGSEALKGGLGETKGVISGGTASLADGTAKGLSVFTSIYTSQKGLNAAVDQAFDKQFGRWGKASMMLDAMAAAQDGTETYEIQDPDAGSKGSPGSANIPKQAIAAFKAKLEHSTDAMDTVLASVSDRALGQLPYGKQAGGLAGAADAWKEAQAAFDRAAGDIDQETGSGQETAAYILSKMMQLTPENIQAIQQGGPVPEGVPVPNLLPHKEAASDSPDKGGKP